jgi:hypothetical protein
MQRGLPVETNPFLPAGLFLIGGFENEQVAKAEKLRLLAYRLGGRKGSLLRGKTNL